MVHWDLKSRSQRVINDICLFWPYKRARLSDKVGNPENAYMKRLMRETRPRTAPAIPTNSAVLFVCGIMNGLVTLANPFFNVRYINHSLISLPHTCIRKNGPKIHRAYFLRKL